MNFQSAHPGGAVEQKRRADCETLGRYLERYHYWHGTPWLAQELCWSYRRVRAVLKAMRGDVEHRRRIGTHGAEEDQWRKRRLETWTRTQSEWKGLT